MYITNSIECECFRAPSLCTNEAGCPALTLPPCLSMLCDTTAERPCSCARRQRCLLAGRSSHSFRFSHFLHHHRRVRLHHRRFSSTCAVSIEVSSCLRQHIADSFGAEAVSQGDSLCCCLYAWMFSQPRQQNLRFNTHAMKLTTTPRGTYSHAYAATHSTQ